ncbi:MAG: hypothetical protein QNK24_10325 [Desulfuromusa sp.]|nr:hypothetical protein [Desulfuromusa sp.]
MSNLRYDQLRGLGNFNPTNRYALSGYDSLRGGCFGALGATSSPSSEQEEYLNEVKSIISESRGVVSQLVNAISDKVWSLDCRYSLSPSCWGKEDDAEKLYDKLNQLEKMMIAPGDAPGDPPGVPLIFHRPKDVLDTAVEIARITKEQAKVLAKWANRSDLEIYWDSFTEALSVVLGTAANSAANIAGGAAAAAIAQAAKDIKKGEFPIWTTIFVVGILGVGVYAGVKLS